METLSLISNQDENNSESSYLSSENEDEDKHLWLNKLGYKNRLFFIENLFHQRKTEINENVCQPHFENLTVPLTQYHIYKSNPVEKFKKWMKKRKKNSRRSFILADDLIQKSNMHLSENIQHLYLNIEFPITKEDSKVSYVEQILGLKLGSFDETNFSLKDRIQILGQISGFEKFENNALKVGSLLLLINDIDVYLSNIEDILRNLELPAKIKLTIQEPNNILSSCKYNCLKINQQILKLLVFEEEIVLEETKNSLSEFNYGLFYLTNDSENEFLQDNIIYAYPNQSVLLLKLHGMFMTLTHMISDIASPPLLSCNVKLQGIIIHIAFLIEGKETMILALPSSCASLIEVQHFVSDIAKVLKFNFLTLNDAFCDENNYKNLNKLFAIIFFHLISSTYDSKNFSLPHLLQILPSVHWLPLPCDIKNEIDDILNELESSDFGITTAGFYENQRIYSILGSCLFYKGYLLSSHFSKSDLLDIYRYLLYYHIIILSRSQSFSQIIIWHEVYPTQFQTSTYSEETSEKNSRYFILIVALNQSIIGTLLKAGGCALKADGYPPPEQFYVEEVQNTLIIIEECGIIDTIEKILHSYVNSKISAEHFFQDINLSNSTLLPFSTRNSSSSSIFGSLMHSDSNSSLHLDKKSSADGESDNESNFSEESYENYSCMQNQARSHSISTGSYSGSNGSNEYSFFHDQTQMNKFSHLFHHVPNIHKLNKSKTSEFRILTDQENTLFYYLHIDPVEGIFLAPINDDHHFHFAQTEILLNFHKCCLSMRNVFERSLRNEAFIKSQTITKYGVNNFLHTSYEQGILFQLTFKESKQKSVQKSLNFWIIGRLCFAPDPREIYVCYHDSVHQDMVELAFQLGFGLSL